MTVRGQSMAPAYRPGRRLCVQPPTASTCAPRRGEVIIVRCPESPRRAELKRIIGLPAERVRWTGVGRMQINGRWLREPYARVPDAPPGDDGLRECRLRRGEYFVAGDHRLYSRDSRHYGPIARSAIMGKVHERQTGDV